MTEDVHHKAKRLILESHIKDLSRSDQILLEEHLNICTVCRKYREGTDATIVSLRNTSVGVDPELVRSTQQLVRARAIELNSRANLNSVATWIAAIMTLMWIAATMPYLWRGFEWVGKRLGIPDLIWQMGFGLWWLLPALVLAAVLASTPSPNGAYRKS
jgi:predicted anti-sigma-YlaC factor YlaD